MPADFRRLILILALVWVALVVIVTILYHTIVPPPAAAMPEIPIYPGAHNTQVEGGPSIGLKRVSYTVDIEPPAQELVDFYDRAMVEAGWHRWKRGHSPKWQSQQGAQGKVSRLVVQWLDKQELWQCDLVLAWSPREGGISHGPDSGQMTVTCTVNRAIFVPRKSQG